MYLTVSIDPWLVRERLRAVGAALVIHTAAFLWFSRVWIFHLTPAAATLPGALGFGWFLRYLTFYSFTLQTVALGLSAAADWAALLGARAAAASALAAAADDLSCAVFGLAHVVTIMYHAINAATAGEGMNDAPSAPRPPWLHPTVHVINAAAAWGDMMAAPVRSFSDRSERMSAALVALYLCWLQLCSHMNGEYPYPFLRAAKQPQGFLLTAAAGSFIFAMVFKAGRAANRGAAPARAAAGAALRGLRRAAAAEWRRAAGARKGIRGGRGGGGGAAETDHAALPARYLLVGSGVGSKAA